MQKIQRNSTSKFGLVDNLRVSESLKKGCLVGPISGVSLVDLSWSLLIRISRVMNKQSWNRSLTYEHVKKFPVYCFHWRYSEGLIFKLVANTNEWPTWIFLAFKSQLRFFSLKNVDKAALGPFEWRQLVAIFLRIFFSLPPPTNLIPGVSHAQSFRSRSSGFPHLASKESSRTKCVVGRCVIRVRNCCVRRCVTYGPNARPILEYAHKVRIRQRIEPAKSSFFNRTHWRTPTRGSFSSSP